MFTIVKNFTRISKCGTIDINLVRGISNSVTSKNFLLTNSFVGEAKESDFKLVEEVLPPLQDGEFRTEALYWSVDPYMRAYVTMYKTPVNTVMMGGQVGKVIESKAPEYKVGDHIFGQLGWRTHTNVNPKTTKELVYKLPEMRDLPLSLGLGAVGMPGITAYFGFLELCEPRYGETVAVSGAAGAVGSLVGQIAKIKGCKVIGFAGSDEKCEWLKKELNFDHAINYRTADIKKALSEAAPNGIDCYFDNVGGLLSTQIMSKMNRRGRISVCGSISSYNEDPKNPPQAPIIQPIMVGRELRMEGFVNTRWLGPKWTEGLLQMIKWIREGKIQAKETVVEGFENMPKALIGMLRGDNTGKAIVKSKL